MNNPTLKSAIYARFRTQREFSDAIGIPELEVTKIVTGRRLPNEKLQKQIARAVGRHVQELFEEDSDQE